MSQSWWEQAMNAKRALEYGEQLANPATWKQRNLRMNAVVGLLTALLPFLGVTDADPEMVKEFAAGIGAAVLLYNSYFHIATSSKIGL